MEQVDFAFYKENNTFLLFAIAITKCGNKLTEHVMALCLKAWDAWKRPWKFH